MVTGRHACWYSAQPGVQRRGNGYAYLALLFAVVLIGAALGGTAQVWHTAMQRERERQLLWVGNQYRLAIQRYTEARAQAGAPVANGANLGPQGLQLGNVTNGGTTGGSAGANGTGALPLPRPGSDGDYGISVNPDGTLPPAPIGGPAGEFGSGLTGGLGAGSAALNAFGEGNSGTGGAGSSQSNNFGGAQQMGGRGQGVSVGGTVNGGGANSAAAGRLGASRYPPNLAVLLADPRFPQLRPYLRQLYPDPITGKVDWVPILAPNGGVMGVRSSSTNHPFKTANFSAKDILFTDKEKYSDWWFVFAPKRTSNQGAQQGPSPTQQQNFGPAPGAPANPQGTSVIQP